MAATIYLIVTPSMWDAVRGTSEHRTPSLESEGFVHASASLEQVLWVANRIYPKEPRLVVLCVDREQLRAPVKDELTSRGEGPFPHVYGPVNLDALIEVRELAREDGRWAGWLDVVYLAMRPNLGVTDVRASLLFYRDLIGLEAESVFDDGSFALLKRGGAELALVRNEAPAQQGAYLYVVGVEAVYARCLECGAHIVAPLTNHPWGLKDFVVADPDGHWIAVGERVG